MIEEDSIIEKNGDFKNELVETAKKCENDLNEIINKDQAMNYSSWMRLLYYTSFYTNHGLEEVLEQIKEIMK